MTPSTVKPPNRAAGQVYIEKYFIFFQKFVRIWQTAVVVLDSKMAEFNETGNQRMGGKKHDKTYL